MFLILANDLSTLKQFFHFFDLLDHMIISFDYKMEFSAAPLFSTLSFIQAGKAKEFIFNKEKSISYMP